MGEQGDEIGREERQRLLLDAVVTMAADLSLDGVLQRIVAIAGELVDARYAALGVLSAGPGPSAADLRPPRHARGAGRGDRSPAAGARRAGAADRPPRAAAPARHQRAPGGVRLPRPAPAHVVLPRRAGAHPGQGVREPLPHREGRRGRLHRRGRGDRGRPRRRGGRRHRERPAVRRGLAAAALARGDRGDHGPPDRGRPGRRRAADDRGPGARGGGRRRGLDPDRPGPFLADAPRHVGGRGGPGGDA